MVTIIQADETETGPRLRKTLVDKHGVECVLERTAIGGIVTGDYTKPKIDLYSYVRPSNGERMWFVEAELFFPPDVQMWRSYSLDESPSDEQIIEIVASDLQAGSHL
ncbi:hypothetical protein [Chelativorans xinjiangense]|uniref:hypothetical protein n=1 Tax=Chelativorans xinjiangense TaxID=2681485 RepID=UPI00135B9255|nr:hypothetical protein [Chelativorans xinjiangense]